MNENRNDVSRRHKKEWQEFREKLLKNIMASRDSEEAKTVRALADLLKTYQEGERKAWDFIEQDLSTDNTLHIKWEE